MRVLITGATGFLGKHVLSQLVSDPRIKRIDAVSRSKRTHPNPKVRILRLDLSDPAFVHQLSGLGEELPDVVIHLAGVYSFKASFAENYQQNVLATVNLMSLMKEWNRRKRVPVLFASTYGVGFGIDIQGGVGERPLSVMPPKSVPYAFTKAIAERAVTDAGVPAMIFRLGVLVGDLANGALEKIDGPYSLMGVLRSASPAGRFLKVVPVPAKKSGVLPLVPVDCAGRVFHEAAHRMAHDSKRMGVEYYGVYNRQSARLDAFCSRVVEEYLPGARAVFVSSVPERALKAQEMVSGIPKDVFLFSTQPLELDNPGFEREFPELKIPSFELFEEIFFSGFERFCGVTESAATAAESEASHG